LTDWHWEDERDLEVDQERIRSVDGGVASEIEYLNWRGERIGYWAYGSYDPSLPYQGETHGHQEQ
jgi:hypothetical protein